MVTHGFDAFNSGPPASDWRLMDHAYSAPLATTARTHRIARNPQKSAAFGRFNYAISFRKVARPNLVARVTVDIALRSLVEGFFIGGAITPSQPYSQRET